MRGGVRGGFAGFGGAGGAFGGEGGFRPQLSVETLISRIDSVLPNPAGIAIALRDSLKLDSGQVVLLQPLRDSLAARNAVRVDSLRHAFQRIGDTPSPSQLIGLMPQMRPLFQAARDDVAKAIIDVHAILRDDQWTMMPASVRTFQSSLFRGFRGGGPRPPN
jgi:hypothetical protein